MLLPNHDGEDFERRKYVRSFVIFWRKSQTSSKRPDPLLEVMEEIREASAIDLVRILVIIKGSSLDKCYYRRLFIGLVLL